MHVYVLAGVVLILIVTVIVIVIVALKKNKSKSRRVQVCFIHCTKSQSHSIRLFSKVHSIIIIYHTPTIPI